MAIMMGILMSDETAQKRKAQKDREERLAAQLRENLKKRKAQARARKNADPANQNAER